MIKRGYGYIVEYSDYEEIKEVELFDSDLDTAKLIFELRRCDWDYSYFDDVYYKDCEYVKYIARIYDKYLVYKMGYLMTFYELFDSYTDALDYVKLLIENNWTIEKKVLTDDDLLHKGENISRQVYNYPNKFLKVSIDESESLYFHEETDDFNEFVNYFNGYMPPKGVYYLNNIR